jgi:hypothetical protein
LGNEVLVQANNVIEVVLQGMGGHDLGLGCVQFVCLDSGVEASNLA